MSQRTLEQESHRRDAEARRLVAQTVSFAVCGFSYRIQELPQTCQNAAGLRYRSPCVSTSLRLFEPILGFSIDAFPYLVFHREAECILGPVVVSHIHTPSPGGQPTAVNKGRDGVAAIPELLTRGGIQGIQDCIR